MFDKYSCAGKKLRELHLFATDIQKDLRLETANNNLYIEKIKYNDGKIYINNDTFINGLTDEIWGFQIGGYFVLDKLLKQHKGELLDIDMFTHIKKVVGIIEETIKVQHSL